MVVRRAVTTEVDTKLWTEVQASVKKGQFAVLTFFVENDEVIHRYSHLSFQEHLCSMVLRRMLDEDIGIVVRLMTNGDLKQMLQGSWWQNTLQFLMEGLHLEDAQQLATRFANTMLAQGYSLLTEGTLALGRKQLHAMALEDLIRLKETEEELMTKNVGIAINKVTWKP